MDGDGVGDACDPEPSMARQRIVLFDPFTSLSPGWSIEDGREQVVNDQLVFAAQGSSLAIARPYAPGLDRLVLGVHTGARGAGGQAVVALQARSLVSFRNNYCELYDNAGLFLFFTVYDGASYTHPGMQQATNALANGDGTLRYDLQQGSARCASTLHGETLEVNAPAPAFAVDSLRLFANNVDVRIDYLVMIRTE
jgi:hypothetical protein